MAEATEAPVVELQAGEDETSEAPAAEAPVETAHPDDDPAAGQPVEVPVEQAAAGAAGEPSS